MKIFAFVRNLFVRDYKSIEDLMVDKYVNKLKKELPRLYPTLDICFSNRDVIELTWNNDEMVSVLYTILVNDFVITDTLRRGSIRFQYDNVVNFLCDRIDNSVVYKLKMLEL
jgi:hypothetical protein